MHWGVHLQLAPSKTPHLPAALTDVVSAYMLVLGQYVEDLSPNDTRMRIHWGV